MSLEHLELVAVVSGKGSTTRGDLDGLQQCDWVERHGTEGYLCCAERRGHEGPHRNVYDQAQGVWPAPSPYEWWYPLKEWERNFGAAARACYGYGDMNYSVGYK